jgi:hypothetical protein
MHATIEALLEMVLSTQYVLRCYIRDSLEQPVECSVDSQLMKRRLGGWCEMAASQSVVRKIHSWKGAAVQRGLEHGNREITIVGAITRQLLVKTLQAGKRLVKCRNKRWRCN